MRTLSKILLLASFAFAPFAKASFEENAHRYMSGQDILWSLSMFFDFTNNKVRSICTELQSLNETLAGGNSPVTGEPISPTPTQGTVLWITGCVDDYLSDELVLVIDKVRTKRLLGEEFFNSVTDFRLLQPWADVPEKLQRALIRHMVSAFLGSDDVIKDFGFIQNPDDFRELLFQAANARAEASTREIVLMLATNLSVRDEFLSY